MLNREREREIVVGFKEREEERVLLRRGERRLTVAASAGYAEGWWGKRKRETPGRKEMKRWKGC